MYVDLTVVVDGAVEQEERFHDYLLLAQCVDGIREDAESDGYLTEVFIVEHDHAEYDAEDCACAQYLTDHRPAHTFNGHEDDCTTTRCTDECPHWIG